jgi:thiamine monophosphate kinase
MDVSDSLYLSIKKMAHQSNKKFIIDGLTLVNPYLFSYFNNKKYLDLILGSGEEYVPVFTMQKSSINKKIISLFKERGIELIKIGKVTKGKGFTFNNLDIKNINSYNHFNENYLKL